MNTNRAKKCFIAFHTIVYCTITFFISFNAIAGQPPFVSHGQKPDYGIDHLQKVLMPFWSKVNSNLLEDAPFPSHVFDDGSPVTIDSIGEYNSKAVENNAGWIVKGVGKNYTRMHARQTFAYGVAFHLTGDPGYFEIMKQGVDYSLAQGFDDHGALTIIGDSEAEENEVNVRTSQDQAYSLIGLAFNYYLTRDQQILDTILKQHQYILDTYAVYDDTGTMRDFLWLPKDTESTELVSILDQLNAYMVLLYPVLPDEHKKKWAQAMKGMCDLMLGKFYVKNVVWDGKEIEVNSFWGDLNEKKFGGKHFDFGHSVKSWWMIYLVGHLLQDEEFIRRGDQGVRHIVKDGFVEGKTLIDAAKERGIINRIEFLEHENTWGEKYYPTSEDEWWVEDGISLGQHWWIHCEMDQAAAMVSKNGDLSEKWLSTSKFFAERFVDHGAGEVWHELDPTTMRPNLMKVHLWKNAYHSFEHALIIAIADKKLKDKEIELHFAIKDASCAEVPLRPYYFAGSVTDIKYSTIGNTHPRACSVKFDLGELKH